MAIKPAKTARKQQQTQQETANMTPKEYPLFAKALEFGDYVATGQAPIKPSPAPMRRSKAVIQNLRDLMKLVNSRDRRFG